MTGRARVRPLVCSDDRVQDQRERGHQLEQPLAKELTARVGDPVADHASDQADGDVGGVGERHRHVVDEHVAGDPTTEPAEEGHEQDADHGEALEVVGSTAQQCAIQRADRGRQQVKGGEVASPLETPEIHSPGKHVHGSPDVQMGQVLRSARAVPLFPSWYTAQLAGWISKVSKGSASMVSRSSTVAKPTVMWGMYPSPI